MKDNYYLNNNSTSTKRKKRVYFSENNLDTCIKNILTRVNKRYKKEEKRIKPIIVIALLLLIIVHPIQSFIELFMPVTMIAIPCIFSSLASKEYLDEADSFNLNYNAFTDYINNNISITKLKFNTVAFDYYSLVADITIFFDNKSVVVFENIPFNVVRSENISEEDYELQAEFLALNPANKETNIEFTYKMPKDREGVER